MSQVRNTTLDDIASVIGFTAAVRLAAHYSHSKVWVPSDVSEHNMLTKLLGISAAKRLVNEWPAQFLSVPTLTVVESEQRNARILSMLVTGVSPMEIATETGLSFRRITQLRNEWATSGLLEAAVYKSERGRAAAKLRAKNLAENQGKNAQEKQGGLPGEKLGDRPRGDAEIAPGRRNLTRAVNAMLRPAGASADLSIGGAAPMASEKAV